MNAPPTVSYSELFAKTKTIAVVGLSDRPERASYGVAQYLRQYFQIIPVNPKLTMWEGLQCYPSLLAIPETIQVDLVDIFRRSAEVATVVEEAIMRKVNCVWMQQGIVNENAAQQARAAGITVIMDACLAVVHSQYRS